MPGSQARSPVGDMQEATTHWCFTPSVSLLPLFLGIYKILKKNLCTLVNPGHGRPLYRPSHFQGASCWRTHFLFPTLNFPTALACPAYPTMYNLIPNTLFSHTGQSYLKLIAYMHPCLEVVRYVPSLSNLYAQALVHNVRHKVQKLSSKCSLKSQMTFLHVKYTIGSFLSSSHYSSSRLTSKLWSLEKSHHSVSTSVHILTQMFTRGQALCYALVIQMNRAKSLTSKNMKSSARGKHTEIHYMAIR